MPPPIRANYNEGEGLNRIRRRIFSVNFSTRPNGSNKSPIYTPQEEAKGTVSQNHDKYVHSFVTAEEEAYLSLPCTRGPTTRKKYESSEMKWEMTTNQKELQQFFGQSETLQTMER